MARGSGDVMKDEHDTEAGKRIHATALTPLLEDIVHQPPIAVERVTTHRRNVAVSKETITRAAAYFARTGLHSPISLVEMRLRGEDLGRIARDANVEADELDAIVTSIERTIDPETLERLRADIARPKTTGQIDWSDPRIRREYEKTGLHPIEALDRAAFDRVRLRDLISYLVPKGPKKSVDLRPFLGDARNQASRGTCAVHGAVCVAEAFEYFRDHRNGPLDLAEQFVWWFRGSGQRYSAGGYDCSEAMRDIRDAGVCEELNLPYQGMQINNNHTQVPIHDKAMDRAQFYRLGDVIGLPWNDVDAVKRVLESGRCVSYGSNLDGWNTNTGEITMPPPETKLGGSHCTTIVGYIDDDSLDESLGGGHFIIRNSWGGAGNTSNVKGPEYGGHLFMPYAWYRLYAGWPATTTDRNDTAANNEWLVEYYDNPELRGAPLGSKHVEINLFLVKYEADVALPQTVAAVDFNWGTGSPVRATLPLIGNVDMMPTDNFSVRYSKVMRFREGWYRFRVRADDGVRLYVDDRLVINQWKDQSSTEYVAEHRVTGGDHVVRVEYYEARGAAEVHFAVEPIQWRYELFRGPTVTGTAAATFDDTITELEWRHAPPVPASLGGQLGQFGLRGTARLHFKSGTYRFHALHTGRFRLFVDGTLRHDDPGGTTSSSAAVTLTDGMHEIRVELENLSTVPAAGSGSYYKASCRFGWSDETWNARFYDDARGRDLVTNNLLRNYPDGNHLFFRTSGLTGAVKVEHGYARDTSDDLRLRFADWSAFVAPVTVWPASFIQPDSNPRSPTPFFGAWINRKVFVPKAGLYNVSLDANEGFRLIIDGKEVVQNQQFIGNDAYNGDVLLDAGVHDVSVEYVPTQWGGSLDLRFTYVAWQVRYFPGKGVTGAAAASATVNRLSEVSSRSDVYYRTDDFSAVATRTLWLPVGRYYFAVKADDGVRLFVNDRPLIDAWIDQAPTDYSASYEHRGGAITIRVEYYQGGGGKALELAMSDQDFYGEYYRGTALEAVPPDSTARKVAPIAYRYEHDVDFDFGRGSYLPRVGASNFSARWLGRVPLPVGRWRIDATADDGVRVFIDGRLLIDAWQQQGRATHSRMIDLTGRTHDVKIEYSQKTDAGVCRVKYVRII
jgi:hypothetical protein